MESVLDPNTGHKIILSSEDNILSFDTLSSVKLWTLRPDAKRRIVAVRLDISNNIFLLLYVASQSKSICTSHTGGCVSLGRAAAIAFSTWRINKFSDKASEAEGPQKVNIADLCTRIVLYASFFSKCK